jgi:hypothetical protein
MGEKGLVGTATDAVDATGGSSSVIASTSETVVSAAGGAAETLKSKLVDKGVDHVIEEARDRLRERGEPDPETE